MLKPYRQRIVNSSTKILASDKEIQIGDLISPITLKLPPVDSLIGQTLTLQDLRGTISSTNKVTLIPSNPDKINNQNLFEMVSPNSTLVLFGTKKGWVILNSPQGMGAGGGSSFTQGSLLFYDGAVINQNNSKLFWDKVNYTLGIGSTRSGSISASNALVLITGSGNTSSTAAFEVKNSSASQNLYVRDDGYVSFSSSKVLFNANASESGSSVAYTFDTTNALTTVGARVYSFRAAGTEILAIGRKIAYSYGCNLEIYLPQAWNVIKSNGRLDLDAGSNNIFISAANLYYNANLSIGRVGDATSTLTQKGSYTISLQQSLWSGSGSVLKYFVVKPIPSTTVNLASRLAFLASAVDSTGTSGTEVFSVDNQSGIWNFIHNTPVNFTINSDPVSSNTGDLWWNGDNLYFNSGSSTVDLLAGGGVTYSAVRSAMLSGGDLPVRYDAVQPEVDCLWVSPTGQVVLITGSP